MGPCLKLSVKLQRLDEATKTTPNFDENEDSLSKKSPTALPYGLMIVLIKLLQEKVKSLVVRFLTA